MPSSSLRRRNKSFAPIADQEAVQKRMVLLTSRMTSSMQMSLVTNHVPHYQAARVLLYYIILQGMKYQGGYIF